MPRAAKIYIAIVAVFGAAILSLVVNRWNPASLSRFSVFFALAMVASTMKIRLPGQKTSISINFIFILIGIALFSFSETVLIAFGGAFVQSLWRPLQRPKPVQIFFNAACLTVCTAAAFWASHAVLAFAGSNSAAAMMAVGACVYVVLNTGLVSLVISLAEGQSLKNIWPQCYEWTLPYFLVGAALSGVASSPGHGGNLAATLLVVPTMYLVHVYYRMHVVRAVLDNISSVSQVNESAILGAPRGR